MMPKVPRHHLFSNIYEIQLVKKLLPVNLLYPALENLAVTLGKGSDNMPRSTHKCLNIYYPSKYRYSTWKG